MNGARSGQEATGAVRSRWRPQLWIGLLMLAASGIAIVQGIGWPLRAVLFPWVIAIPMFILSAVQVGLDLRRAGEAAATVGAPPPAPRPAASSGGGTPTAASGAAVRRRLLGVLSWCAALVAGLWLLGFPTAVPLFVFANLQWSARERFRVSAALAVASWLFVYGVAYREIHLTMPTGLLWTWLG
jgi:hypothetical protein